MLAVSSLINACRVKLEFMLTVSILKQGVNTYDIARHFNYFCKETLFEMLSIATATQNTVSIRTTEDWLHIYMKQILNAKSV
jgi:hypothetical protein